MKKLYTTFILLLFCGFSMFAQTETEPNDNINQGSNAGNTFTASTSSTLSIGATITVANNDFFKINLPTCTSWAFNIINPSGQGIVNLKFYNVQNSTTSFINTDFNFNSGLPSPVVVNCGQTIWVQIDQTTGSDIGTYQLQVYQYTTGDTFECNNDFNSANIIPSIAIPSINTSFSAKLWGYDCNGNPDADYFTYTPTQCGVLKVQITNENIDADLTINVYDDATPTRNLITTLQLNGDFGALLEAGQKYYFVITDLLTGGFDGYDLFDDPFTVTTSYDISEIECNNTFTTAKPLPLNTSFDIKLWGQNSQINIPDNRPQDADYFFYTPTQCGVMKIQITNENIDADLTINVYDDATPTKNLITTLQLNGDFGALLEANQKYYFVITDLLTGGFDGYDLFNDPFTVTTSYDTSDIYECNNTFPTAKPLPINTNFNIKLWGQNSQINIPDNRPQDADYFFYTPTQCGVMKVQITDENIDADLTINVYDDATPTKNLITTLQLNGDFGALLEAGQKYYFVITDLLTGGFDGYDLFDDTFTVTTTYDTSDTYECNNTYTTAKPLPLNTSFDIKLWGQNSQINIPDNRRQDADYFFIQPAACSNLTLNLTSFNLSAELKIEIFKDQLPIPISVNSSLSNTISVQLEANQKYYIVITDLLAGGFDGYDLFDDPFTVTTTLTTLAPTPTPIITPTGTNGLTLTTPTATGNVYQWYSVNSSNVRTPVGTNSPSNTVTATGTYIVCVSNTNTCGTSCSTPKVINSLANTNFEETKFTIYPNPTYSVINLQFSNSEVVDKVIISDLTGKKLLEKTQHTTQINVENLAKGTYIIQAYFGDKKLTSKFIKE